MDTEFWLHKWENNDIGFHNQQANPLLVKHLEQLGLPSGSRLFLPLCGKTLDIGWLLAKGYKVAGAELSRLAVIQLFDELGFTPQISRLGELEAYSANNLVIFIGDIFKLTESLLGEVDAVYDRAALVALPTSMRAHYTRHLMDITHNSQQLLISFEYDQSQMEGPPFSVPASEIDQYYGSHYNLQLLASADVEGGLKGKCAAKENVWLLKPDRNRN
ncbi:MAG: thiopurine S-methyltransferase [Cellvibrio sp. 79]|nr:MAG: thiopurine S-methyltransferase [Cellvibrio sp. 79]